MVLDRQSELDYRLERSPKILHTSKPESSHANHYLNEEKFSGMSRSPKSKKWKVGSGEPFTCSVAPKNTERVETDSCTY
jgi:hypothetical protein